MPSDEGCSAHCICSQDVYTGNRKVQTSLKPYRIKRAPADPGHLREGSLKAGLQPKQQYVQGRGDNGLELVLLPCHIHLPHST